MSIYIKSEAEIAVMRKADILVAKVLRKVREHAKPGVSTLELDRLAEDLTRQAGAKPAFLGYQGAGPYPFPASLCTSINEEVVHGIPSAERKLVEGDILIVIVAAVRLQYSLGPDNGQQLLGAKGLEYRVVIRDVWTD